MSQQNTMGVFQIIKTNDKYVITYDKGNHSYTGIIEPLAKYFTYSGYITKLKYIDGFAQYTMVKIPMTEVIKELTIYELQKRIRRLENIVCLLLKSKDNDEAIAAIKTKCNLVIGYDDISGEYEFNDNANHGANAKDKDPDYPDYSDDSYYPYED